MSNTYDLKIINAEIADGTGGPLFSGEIGIRDGLLTAVGDATGDATETIDASGHIVAPGFIDIHTHYDAQILWDRMLTISPWHGVTTVVMGNCGFSVAPTRREHRDIMIRQGGKSLSLMSVDIGAAAAGGRSEWIFHHFNFGTLVLHQYLNFIVFI